MNRTLLIIRHEIISNISRPSFIIFAIILPVISFILLMAIATSNSGTATFKSMQRDSKITIIEGLVDESGLIKAIPGNVSTETLKRFKHKSEAIQALKNGKIKAYYLVPKTFIKTGRLIYIAPRINANTKGNHSGTLQQLLIFNLLEGDKQAVEKALSPVKIKAVRSKSISPISERKSHSKFLPFIVTLIYSFIILMSSSLFINSMINEKKNSVLEMLLLSIDAKKLFTGKITALGAVGLIQVIVWTVTGYIFLALKGSTINNQFNISPIIILWGCAFFLLGYGLYACVTAGVGVRSASTRLTTQLSPMAVLPLIAPLFILEAFNPDIHGPFFSALSFFPFTSPVAMMTRLSTGQVPLWQTLLAIALLVAFILIAVRMVSRMIVAQSLLSDRPVKLKKPRRHK